LDGGRAEDIALAFDYSGRLQIAALWHDMLQMRQPGRLHAGWVSAGNVVEEEAEEA